MDEKKSKQNVSTTSSEDRPSRQRMAQNFLLIWVDTGMDELQQDCRNTLAQLRSIVNDVHVFDQQDEAIDFLNDIDNMKAFLVVSGTIGQLIVPLIHNISQLDAIYILCEDQSIHKQWAKEWVKIKGVHTEIKSICEELQLAIKQHNRNMIAVSFVPTIEESSNQNLNQLEPSFMYTQIFKDILLQMEHDDKSFQNFIQFWRQHYINNVITLNIITQFEDDYSPQSSIKWYTREYFIYQMLNQALRLLEGDTIITMGFFIRDLHQQIKQLHQKQISSYGGMSFTLYRGQGLLIPNFEKLLKSKGGLMSFNNFLSTSEDREVSLGFAIGASTGTDMVGILFKMTIDPCVSSAPFASIRDDSYYKAEEEVLFSMHSVFRVEEISQLDNNSSLYQVDLSLTADDDQDLRNLTAHLVENVQGKTGWERLGDLLLKLNQIDKAIELYDTLLEQTSDQDEKAAYYNQLGSIKDEQGDYEKAIKYHEKSLAIREKTVPANQSDLAQSYNNIGKVHRNMGEYLKALSFYEKTREIFEQTLPANHSSLAASYNNIGSLYDDIGEYSKALSFYKKSLDIREKILPANHPDLACSYDNISSVYDNIGEYSKALPFYEQSFKIREKTLPENHPDLANSYNNIASVYKSMGEYSKALLLHEKCLEIQYKALPTNHPNLASSYSNIGMMYDKLGEHLKALSFYEKSLDIREKTLSANHPALAKSYNNIGSMHYSMGEYSKALPFLEKAREIFEQVLPANHPLLAICYSNISSVYNNIGEYSKALSFYNKTYEIFEKTLPTNHQSLATSYNNIGMVYKNMGEYSKALSFYEKATEIFEKTLPANHPDLATSYDNIGMAYDNMGEYSKALSFYKKSLEIRVKTLPTNHPSLATFYNSIGMVYYNIGEYSQALSSYQRAQNIWQSSLPSNHPNIEIIQRIIEYVKKKM